MLDANNSYGVVCVDCLESKYYFDRAFSVFNYEKIIASVILKFKFSRKMFLSKFLAKFLFMKYKEIDERIDYIIPVPMHIKKLRQRGYNQSLMLAYELSKLVNIPCVYDMLLKQKNTRAQIGSSHIARKRNLKSAFSMKEKYKGLFFDKNVLIVDDVMTTGTTASECAKVLKTNGIGKVFVLSVAKTQNNSSLARYKKAIKKMFIYKEIIEGESLEKVPSLVQNSPHS
jgi:competence protein ComFC